MTEHHPRYRAGYVRSSLFGLALIAGAGIATSSPAPAQAGEICSAAITPVIKAQISRVIRDGGEKRIRLNCHDFKISARMVFDLEKGAYGLSGKLTHVKKLDFDNSWRYGFTLSEDGRKWQLDGIHDFSLKGRPNPLEGNWEREAKRLINEAGRLAAERIRKHVAACNGGDNTSTVRDHRVERRDHRTRCRLDVPTTG